MIPWQIPGKKQTEHLLIFSLISDNMNGKYWLVSEWKERKWSYKVEARGVEGFNLRNLNGLIGNSEREREREWSKMMRAVPFSAISFCMDNSNLE